MPDADTGAVESVDAEVDRVVELVLDHAVKPAARVAHGDHRERNVTPCGCEQAVLAALSTRPLTRRLHPGRPRRAVHRHHDRAVRSRRAATG